MADRFYRDIELPNFDGAKVVPAPDAGFIQLYGKDGYLVVNTDNDLEQIITENNGVFSNNVSVTINTSATDVLSGALTVAGGISTQENLWVGGTANVAGITSITDTTASTSATTGALVVTGGAGVGLDLHVGGDLHLTGTGTVRIGDIDINGYDDHIWYVSDGVGNDLNNGHREWSAFRTIKKALSVADSGDTVFILPGEYEEIFPLTVPKGVSVRGAGLRETQIFPTVATKDLDCFLLSGESTISDVTIKGMFYNSTNDTGYAFRFQNSTVIDLRSPYIERITVLNQGSTTSSTDPYGFASGDAGRGALIDGSKVSRGSIEAAMLFNEVTFIVPNSRGIIMTNGARCEFLTCFTYFADLAIEGKVGALGRAGDGKTYLTFSGISGAGFSVGETIRFIGTGGTPTVDFTVEAVSGNKVTVDGSLNTLEGLDLSPGAGGSITGLTSSTTATAITRYDRSEFAAELRAISCANEYGNQGTKADGADVVLQLMAHNMAYIGTGADLTNDKSAVNQAAEVIEVNGGRVYYNTVDQSGNYRIGDLFLVDFETGAVTFDGGSFDVSALGSINFTSGANATLIDAFGVTTGNISISGNSITTSTGNLTIDPSGAGTIALNGGTTVTGTFSSSGNTTLTANTASSSTTTGTLVVTGGVGVSEDLYVGGDIIGNVAKANNIAGGAANQLLYQTALDTTGFVTAPTTSGTFLRWNGTALDWAAVTASAAGSANQIQYNSGGNLAASANFTYDPATNRLGLTGTDPEILLQGITTEPAAPAAEQLYIYAKNIGGRMLPKVVGPSGFDTALQPLLATNKIAWWNPPGNATTVPGVVGFNAPTTSGTATTRNVATTNILTRAKRIGYNSGNNAGSPAGHYSAQAQFTIGTGTIGVGGFYYICRFGSGINRAGDLMFTGLTSSIAAPGGNTSPATLTNCIGVGAAVGDTNMSIYYGGSAAQTPIALGASFPKNSTNTIYELILFAASNVNNEVDYRVTNLATGVSASGTLTAATPGTQLPLSTTLLAHRSYRANGATAGATEHDIISVYIETDT